jgi:hypothetical protein
LLEFVIVIKIDIKIKKCLNTHIFKHHSVKGPKGNSSSSNEDTSRSWFQALFKQQDSLEKWLNLGLGPGKIKTNPEYFVVPECKETLNMGREYLPSGRAPA